MILIKRFQTAAFFPVWLPLLCFEGTKWLRGCLKFDQTLNHLHPCFTLYRVVLNQW